MSQNLSEHRQLASQASGGVSSDPIYQTFVKIVEELNLKGALLDFGAGTGNLINYLNHPGRFSSITAADMMLRPSTIDLAVEWLSTDLNSPLGIKDQSFDVIVSSEVIEHLENPRAVAREWFRLLRPGGTLILSTPNNESWRAISALILRGHFVFFGDNCYPAHITALLRKDISRILTEAGFSDIDFRFTDNGGLPKFPYLSWQKLSWGLCRGMRYSDNILAAARRIS